MLRWIFEKMLRWIFEKMLRWIFEKMLRWIFEKMLRWMFDRLRPFRASIRRTNEPLQTYTYFLQLSRT
jgi:hypothetical protein